MRVKGQQNCYEITFKHLELIFQEIFDQLLTFYLDRRVAGLQQRWRVLEQ